MGGEIRKNENTGREGRKGSNVRKERKIFQEHL